MRHVSTFDLSVAYWSFGWLSSDRLPGVAIEALESGIESPSLIELASEGGSANPDLHGVFEKALTELGRHRLNKCDSGRIIACEIAEKICSHEIAPIDGARAIWRISLECEDLNSDLGIFGGRVSEYESLAKGRDGILDRIIRSAQELVQNCGCRKQ